LERLRLAVKRNSPRLESAEISGKYKEPSHVTGFQKAASGRGVKTFGDQPRAEPAQQSGGELSAHGEAPSRGSAARGLLGNPGRFPSGKQNN